MWLSILIIPYFSLPLNAKAGVRGPLEQVLETKSSIRLVAVNETDEDPRQIRDNAQKIPVLHFVRASKMILLLLFKGIRTNYLKLSGEKNFKIQEGPLSFRV